MKFLKLNVTNAQLISDIINSRINWRTEDSSFLCHLLLRTSVLFPFTVSSEKVSLCGLGDLGTHYLVQASLGLPALPLPQLPECWAYQCKPPHSDLALFPKMSLNSTGKINVLPGRTFGVYDQWKYVSEGEIYFWVCGDFFF